MIHRICSLKQLMLLVKMRSFKKSAFKNFSCVDTRKKTHLWFDKNEEKTCVTYYLNFENGARYIKNSWKNSYLESKNKFPIFFSFMCSDKG